MCGILGLKEKTTSKEQRNKRIALRGQDLTNTFGYKGFTFVHNLLSVTGEFTPQPFVEDNIVCLYNGEIYNHKFKKSDGEVLIPLYKKYGTDFPKYLDGEFSIALFDFNTGTCTFATDPFKTKPLFINGVEFASYRSGCGGDKANPNEIVVKDIKTEKVLEVKPVVEWDLRQHKDTYDDWLKAFQNSIRKGAKDGCFIGLSSGYDSGAIACELLNQGIDFKAYSFKGAEELTVLAQRASFVDHEYFNINYDLLPWLKENTDNEEYTIKYKNPQKYTFHSEGGSLGVATFCDLAHKEGRKVCLSSQGADEIMSDYNKMPDQSELAKFPKDLKLWNNFNYGCQESYLIKEEYAGGAFNIETRYPFLDKDLVQEFLWLSQDLKNKYYKAPLREYLEINHFPYEEDVKRGFSVAL